VTDRSRKGLARVTSWLAGWIDYAFAIVFAAGRLLRVPRASAAGAAPSPAQHWLVRPAEVAMLTVSFFLTAHLISGGTDSVSAPQLNPFSMLSTSASADEPLPGMATTYARDLRGGTVVVVVTASPAGAATTAESEPPPPSATPEPAPAPAPGAAAMGASIATPVAEPSATPPPAPEPPAPTPSPEPTPAPAPPPRSGPMSYAEVVAAAAAAGWPASLQEPAARVAWCESRYRPDAIGYGVTYGLMQLIPYWFEAVGLDFALWSDPVSNMRAALAAYQSDIASGSPAWSAWTCKPDQITVPE